MHSRGVFVLAERVYQNSRKTWPSPDEFLSSSTRLIQGPIQGELQSYRDIPRNPGHGIGEQWEKGRTNKDANVSASIGDDRKETPCCPQIRARDSLCN